MSEHRLDPADIERLEEACESALEKIIVKFLGEVPGPRTCHLMAKAAVTVLEAATDRSES